MNYLVTFSFASFIRISKAQRNIESQFRGYENGLPSYKISLSNSEYNTDLIEDSFAEEFGNLLSSFSEEKF